MADSIRARISSAIVKFLEPQIQTMITERIRLFRRKLILDGLVLDSLRDGSKRSNLALPIADPPKSGLGQHE